MNWRAVTSATKPPIPPPKPRKDDDWETEPDFLNDLSERESRWGAKCVTGSGHQEAVKMDKLREDVVQSDKFIKENMPNKSSIGYGGRFGVQKDNMDKCAEGYSYRGKVEPHHSQIGFGGTYGIEKDRKDKSAIGWEDQEKIPKHQSQIDYKKGFGGQFGVEIDRMDKSAMGWDNSNEDVKRCVKATAEGTVQKGNAFDLRNKFEQLMQKTDSQDKIREERERRKQEDEKLRKEQIQEEHKRQLKIDADWTKNDNNQDVANNFTEKIHSPPPRSIGIRLPYATAILESIPPPAKPLRTSVAIAPDEQLIEKQGIEIETTQQQGRIVPPELLFNRRKSSRESEGTNDDEWAQEEESFKLQQPPLKKNHDPKTLQPSQITNEPLKQSLINDVSIQVYEESVHEVHAQSQSLSQLNPSIGPEPEYQLQASGLTAIALFEYEKQDNDEISFDVNDLITDIEKIDVGWWRGMCKGRFGLFPANYVSELNDNS